MSDEDILKALAENETIESLMLALGISKEVAEYVLSL